MYTTQLASMVKTSNHTQKDTTVNTVLKTNDYSKFKTKKGNRDLNELHLKRLMTSVQELDLLHANPILVNEDFEIIDGQHRFNVCNQLKKPIYYTISKGLGLREIQVLNANTKNWKMEDYIDGYCSMQMPEYCYLKNLLNTSGLGISHLLAMFATGGDSGNAANDVKNGNLKLPYKNRGLILLQWIKEWIKFYEGSDRRAFVLALVNLYNIKGYSHEKMMQKIKYQSTKIVDCTNTKTYLALLEEIYNFKERGDKLRFF
jgi:hypothetical protein